MTRLWNKKTVPHKGWKCVGSYDLRHEQGIDYKPATCSMCNRKNLRYIRSMRHPKLQTTLVVGRTCAKKMQREYTLHPVVKS